MKKITKQDWVYMAHAAHLCISNYCRFHLATKVGKYIVSTVGEYVPDSAIRKVYEEIRSKSDVKDDTKFESIGWNRTYETMVFKARKRVGAKVQCCPYEAIIMGGELDMGGYNDPVSAYRGHLKMCDKWTKKQNNGKRNKKTK